MSMCVHVCVVIYVCVCVCVCARACARVRVCVCGSLCYVMRMTLNLCCLCAVCGWVTDQWELKVLHVTCAVY